ncbi:MAG TPA: efflux RND transporter periplasmic adaptor subunit [Desulfosporosinus sp.]|nr:efflux RND transporter periplasmic adaptor subunit [Desulfosporosinus sp.]
MIRNKLIFILVLVLLIVGGITFFKKNAAPVSNDLGIPIKVIIAETGGLTKGINYTGTIESVNSATVSSKLTSEVIEKTIQEGDLVKKGDIIARLDNRNLVALLDSTVKKIDTLRVNYAYLNKEVETYYANNPMVKKIETLGLNYTYLSDEADKYKILLDNEAVAKSAYDKVKHEADMVSLQIEEAKASSEATYNQLKSQRDSTGAQLKELEAKVNELNISIADASILAPIAGKVRTTFYQVGDLAAGGKPFAVIDATDGYRIKVDVSEQDLGKISVGSKVILNITGVIDGIDARVTKVLPSVNSKTRVGEVEIAITELGGKDIVTGTSAEVKFVTDELKDGIVITRTAIKSLKDSEFVYVINDGVAHEQKIKTGLVVDDSVQVIEGLNAGAAIAGNNLTRLYDGVKVYVSEGGGKR